VQQCKVLSLIKAKAWDHAVNYVVSGLHDRVIIIVQETERHAIIFLCFIQVGDKVAKCFKSLSLIYNYLILLIFSSAASTINA